MLLAGYSCWSPLKTFGSSVSENVLSSEDLFSDKYPNSENLAGWKPFRYAIHMENACRNLTDESNSTE